MDDLPNSLISSAEVSDDCVSNKNIKMSSFKSSENIQKKEEGQTDLFRIINPLH